MKLVMILLTTAILQVSASGFAQKITMVKENAALNLVIKEIRKQTGYDFILKRDLLNNAKPVSINVKNANLIEVLNACFKDQPFTYSIVDKAVIVKEKEASVIEVIKDKITGLFQQDSVIYNGRVLDETGKPLPGASVRIKQTMRGVVTNELGRFSIKAPTTGAVLFISYIGYINKEVTLTGNNSKLIEARMEMASANLKQVEVVSDGYQNIPKERAVGSFETVTAKQLEHSTDPNLLRRLEGITASVNFNNNEIPTVRGQKSLQGKSSLGSVTVRGKNTLNITNDVSNTSGQPLLVVDGIPSAYDITQINPSDVETVTLLKDAAAASIWGSRAANGVIVVTTKKGGFDRPVNVSFNSNYNVTEKPDLFYYRRMSTSDFIDAQRKQFIDQRTNLGSPTAQFPQSVYSSVAEIMDKQLNQKTITEAQANAMLDALRGNDVRNDAQKYLLRNTLRQSYSLGVDGGSKRMAYRLSGGYDRSNANVVGYGDSRLTLNYSSTFKVAKNLDISAVLGYIQQSQQNLGPNNAVGGDPSNFNPYDRLTDDSGNPLPIAKKYRPAFMDALKTAYGNKILDMTYKPLEDLNEGFLDIRGQGYNMNFTALYKILPGLSANLTYSYNRFVNDQETYYSKDSFYMRELVNYFTNIASNGNVSYGIPKGGYDANLVNTSTSNTLRGQLNFNRTWKSKHNLSVMAGVDGNQAYSEYSGNQVFGYNLDNLRQNTSINYAVPLPTLYYNLSFQNTYPVPGAGFQSGYSRGRTLSSFANASYTYDDRYTAYASIRKDGSNTFASTTNQSGTPFYSFGGLWNIAGEPFYSFEWVPILKLRGSYGYNGNTNPLMSPTARINRIDFATSLSGLLYNTLTPSEATNNNYRPERTGMLNLGLEYGLKGGRLSGSFEYYIKNTKDLITNNSLDPSTGFNALQYNTGDLLGYGIDFTLSSVNIRSEKFNWTSNFLISYNRVKVKKFYRVGTPSARDLLNDNGPNSYTVGYDLSRVFAITTAGLDPQTGSPRGYINGNMVIFSEDQTGLNNYNAWRVSSPDNVKYMGSSVPVYFGSLRNTFNYGPFSVSANIIYKFKYVMRRPINDLFLSQRLFDGQNGNLVGGEYADRWRKPGDEAFTNVPSLTFPIIGVKDFIYQNSDINVIKADHIRLQEINVSYTVNKKNWFLKNPRIYANVSNMGILWRANRLGIDPEVYDVPQPRTYSFGLSANF